jgi:hypothetical protein
MAGNTWHSLMGVSILIAGGIAGALICNLQKSNSGLGHQHFVKHKLSLPTYAYDPVLISYAYFEKDGIQVSGCIIRC